MFEEYMTTGGLPALLDFNERSVKQVYLDFYSTVVYRDILGGKPTKTMDLLDRVINFIIVNIGNPFSANRIKNFLKNGQRTTAVDTILNILKRCEDAYLIKKAPRYEINGKKVLKTEEKYYLAEHGIREANGYSNKKDVGRVLENIVFNELNARGYIVKVGKIKDREIDFVAEKGGETKYIQVCYLLADGNIQKRESGGFDGIKDHQERIVLSMDKINFSQNGIRHYNIIDFLFNKIQKWQKNTTRNKHQKYNKNKNKENEKTQKKPKSGIKKAIYWNKNRKNEQKTAEKCEKMEKQRRTENNKEDCKTRAKLSKG